MYSSHTGQGAWAALPLWGHQHLQERELLEANSIYCSQAHLRTRKRTNHSPGITQLTFVFTLINHVHSCGQVPHLDAAIGMSSEEVAAWPGAHPAGSFTFSHSKWRDGSAVNCLDLTDPTGREIPNYLNNCTWQSLATEVSTGSFIFWEGTKLAIRKRLFLQMKFLPFPCMTGTPLSCRQSLPTPSPSALLLLVY